MSSNVDYNQDISIFNGELITTAFPLQTTNKEIKNFQINLGNGQFITSATLLVDVTLPGNLLEALGFEPSCTVYLNGNVMTRFVWGNGEPDTQSLETDVTSQLKTNVSNSLEIDVDGATLNAGFKVSADVVYALNTVQGPTNNPGGSVQNQNPPSTNPFGLPSLPTWAQIKPYVIVGALAIGAIVFVPKFVEAIVTEKPQSCKSAIC